VLYSTTTISGPPLALMFNNPGVEKNEFRAALGTVRIVEPTATAIVYGFLGLFTSSPVPSDRRKCANLRAIFEFSAENAKIADWLAEKGECEPPRPFRFVKRNSPKFGGLLGPRKSIRAGEKLFQVVIHRRTFSGFADNLRAISVTGIPFLRSRRASVCLR
jgi:hypothetical protein